MKTEKPKVQAIYVSLRDARTGEYRNFTLYDIQMAEVLALLHQTSEVPKTGRQPESAPLPTLQESPTPQETP